VQRGYLKKAKDTEVLERTYITKRSCYNSHSVGGL